MCVKDGRAAETHVSVGIASTQHFELLDGLAEGDKLITGPTRMLKDLKDGSAVKLRQQSDSEIEAASKQQKGQ
jgi:hypothetical protein